MDLFGGFDFDTPGETRSFVFGDAVFCIVGTGNSFGDATSGGKAAGPELAPVFETGGFAHSSAKTKALAFGVCRYCCCREGVCVGSARGGCGGFLKGMVGEEGS